MGNATLCVSIAEGRDGGVCVTSAYQSPIEDIMIYLLQSSKPTAAKIKPPKDSDYLAVKAFFL